MYDEIGRLVGAIDAAGNGSTYNYDAAGNIVSITATGVVSIISFTPKSGPVGAAVTISGTGFSTTPSANTVTFNGTTATVSSATANQIVAVVPAGATTGAINITTPSGSATSTTSFTVGPNLTPTITNFTPSSGAAGTAVTITGTNYQTTPTNNNVTFNGKLAVVSSATATTLAVAAPVGVVSGRIVVTTPYGQVVSANDYFAAPTGFNQADVQPTGRFVVNGSSTSVSITTSGKIGLFLFDGIQNQNLGLGVSNMTCTGSGLNTSLTVFTPDGVVLGTPFYASVPGTSFKLPTLPKSGTYEIVVDPNGTDTCTMTLTISTEIVGGAIAVDGSVATLSTRSGQNARYTFAGTVGQNLGLGWSAMTTVPASGATIGRIYKPDGTSLATCNFYNTPGNCNVLTLPVTGTYTLALDSAGGSAVNVTLTLSTDIVVGTLAANGATQTFTTARVGQNGRYSFAGTAGQNISILWTGTTFVGSSTVISVLKPDGTSLSSGNASSASAPSGTIDLTNLPVTGTYTVFVDPFAASTGQITLALKQDAAGTIAVNGATLPISLAAGQNGRYTFAGTAGQNLGLGWSAFTTTPAGGSIVGRFFKPDGTLLAICGFFTTPGNCNVVTLPVTGTYTLAIDPQGVNSANVTLTLSTDLVVGTLVANGAAQTFTTTRIGRNGRYSFAGTAGQNISILWTGTTFVGSSTVISVLKPDGTSLSSGNASSASAPSGTIDLTNLPVTGTYTVFVDPFAASTGQITLALKQDAAGTIAVNGATLPISLAAGQNGRYTFPGTAGQNMGLGWSAFTTTPTGGIIVGRIFKPDGTLLTTCNFFTTPGNFNVPTLPVTGTYTLTIDPQGVNSANVTLTLSTDVVVGTLAANGAAQTFTTTRIGQNGSYLFTGTAGVNFSLIWSGTTFVGVSTVINVLKPDGTQLTQANASSTSAPSGTLSLGSLPVTGTYSVFIDPFGASTGSITTRITSP